jgi:hypothetical protein
MYKKSIEGINEVLKECWRIYQQKDTVPPLVRLSALRLVKDCNEAIFGLRDKELWSWNIRKGITRHSRSADVDLQI